VDVLKSLDIVPPGIKLFCVEVMGELGDISVVPSLFDLLKRADENLLNAILITLGKLGDRSAVPVLRKYLVHEIPAVRLAAAKGGEFLAAPELIPDLLHIIENDFIHVRLAAGEALRRCEANGRDALIELSHTHDETVRLVALQFLEEDYTQRKTPRRW
jgi:HEAT repeat protein